MADEAKAVTGRPADKPTANTTMAQRRAARLGSGALAAHVAEVVADHGLGCRLVRQGVRLEPGGPVGSQAWFEGRAGLTPEAIAAAARTGREAGRG